MKKRRNTIDSGMYCLRNRAERGSSLIELSVALLLAGLLFLIFFQNLKVVYSFYRRQIAQFEIERKKELIRETINQAVLASQVRYAIPGIRTHQDGAIVDIRGEPFARAHPAMQSSALSFLELSPGWLLRTAGSPQSSGPQSISISLCALRARVKESKLKPSDVTAWIAVGPDSYIEIKGSVRSNSRLSKLCPGAQSFFGTFSLSPAPMFGRLKPAEDEAFSPGVAEIDLLSAALIFFPIAESYTIYTDNQGNLRRVSHITEENQPLIYGVENLQILPSPVPNLKNAMEISVLLSNTFSSAKSRISLTVAYPLDREANLNNLIL